MLSKDLNSLLTPFQRIQRKQALTQAYQAICIEPKALRSCCAWAIVEADADLGLAEPAYVNAESFLAVMASLPPSEEVKLSRTDGALAWACGSAKGRLALLQVEADLPKISRRAKPGATVASRDLANALELGALSGGAGNLAQSGLFGTVLDNAGAVPFIRSCDDVTIASYSLPMHLEQCPDNVTLAPDGLRLLANLCHRGGGAVEFDDKTVYYRGKGLRVLINQIPPLKHDLKTMCDAYEASDTVVKIPRERVAAFVRRATALADEAKRTFVLMGVNKGQLSLSFAEGTSTTEEFYLLEDLDVPDVSEILLDAGRMARVLDSADNVVFDHIERKVLVFKSDNNVFRYIISGRGKE